MLVESWSPLDLSRLQTGGIHNGTVQYLWLDPTGEVESEITSVSFVRDYSTVSRGRPPVLSTIPFTVLPSASVTESGAVITDGVSPEIREHDLQGALRRIFRVEQERRPVRPDMIEAKIEKVTTTGGSREFYEGLFSQMPIPDSLPAFQGLLVDELGWLWAEVYDFDPARPREWVVFDSEGRALGTVRTPPGLEVQWMGRDAILGVWKDEFEVEYVHRYRLDRGAIPLGSNPGD